MTENKLEDVVNQICDGIVDGANRCGNVLVSVCVHEGGIVKSTTTQFRFPAKLMLRAVTETAKNVLTLQTAMFDEEQYEQIEKLPTAAGLLSKIREEEDDEDAA